MKEIIQNDLKVFPELLYLNLGNNDIQVLEQDLFKYNPKLYQVILTKNDIASIHPNILDDLTNLSKFDVTINSCISGTYSIKTLQEFKKAIAVRNLKNYSKTLNLERLRSKEENIFGFYGFVESLLLYSLFLQAPFLSMAL